MATIVQTTNINTPNAVAVTLNTGDNILVMPNVAVVGSFGIFSGGSQIFAQILGTVWGSIALNGTGGKDTISIGSAGNVVGGGDAILLYGKGNVISNAGEITAIDMSGGGNNFAVEFDYNSGGNSTVTNSGLITGPSGVAFFGGGNTLTNNGTISSTFVGSSFPFTASAVSLSIPTQTTDKIFNSGTLSVTYGQGFAINASTPTSGSFGELDLTNSGHIDGTVASIDLTKIHNTGSITGPIELTTPSGLTDRIVNSGSIDDAILDTGTGTLSITNSGQIEAVEDTGGGNILLSVKSGGSIATDSTHWLSAVQNGTGGNEIDNNGNISSNYTTVFLQGGSNTIVNNGAITGHWAIELTNGDNRVINGGSIVGSQQYAVLLQTPSGHPDVINNSGTIQITLAGAAAIADLGAGSVLIRNSGVIDGDIVLNGGGNSVLNSAHINGSLALGIIGYVQNTGSIDGDVSFAGGNNTLDDRHGTINGGVLGGSGNDTFMGGVGDETFNGGSGNDVIRGGYGDDVINGGGGNNTLLGGSGDDTVSAGSGKDSITGGAGDDVLAGGKGEDTFSFSGAFGNDTISDFTADSGAGHDTLQFANNDFSSFAQVQSHMAQTGADVVITLDTFDTITLQNVLLSKLVAADFLFG